MHIHEPRFRLSLGRSQAGQNRLFELRGNTAACRQKGLQRGMVAIPVPEQIGNDVRNIVDRWASNPLFIQQTDSFAQIGAAIFQVSRWLAHGANEALEQGRDGLTRPGIGHRHSDTMHVLKTRSLGDELMVVSVHSQNRQDLARAQGNAHIDHPDETIAGRRPLQRQALQRGGRLDAHHGEPRHPVDDRLRTGRLLDAKDSGQYPKDSRHGAKADASHQEQLQSQKDQINFVLNDSGAVLRLQLALASPGVLELFLEEVSDASQSGPFLAQLAIFLGSLSRLALPSIPALSELGVPTHHAGTRQDRAQPVISP